MMNQLDFVTNRMYMLEHEVIKLNATVGSLLDIQKSHVRIFELLIKAIEDPKEVDEVSKLIQQALKGND